MSLFDQVSNGNILIETEEELMTEATYPESLPYMKMIQRTITLPKGTPVGKGNLCFLYTNNVRESIQVIGNKTNFMNQNKYFYYFYNQFYVGTLYNRNYKIHDKKKREEIYDRIEAELKITPYKKLVIDGRDTRNMYFDLSKYLEIFYSICDNLSIPKYVKLYWEYISQILFSHQTSFYQNKFVLINIDYFPMNKRPKDNMHNLLYLIYYTLFQYFDLIKDINIDFIFYTNKSCLKINPSTCDEKSYKKLKVQMLRLYDKIPEIEKIIDEESIKSDSMSSEITDSINNDLNKSLPSEDVMTTTSKNEEEKKSVSNIEKNISDKISTTVELVRKEVDKVIPDTSDVTKKAIIKKKVEEELDENPELKNQIYKKILAEQKPKVTASSARDELLKKEQEKIMIDNISIHDLKKIQAANIPIPVKDISHAVRTTNHNMTQIKFNNFEKTYNEKLLKKDIVDAILCLNEKSIPMYVRDIQIADTSDELNYKDTYTILLEDANRQRHTIKVDIPKFIEDKFLYLGGNKKVIKHQSFLYPIVKCDEDTVQIVTNDNKMFIKRIGTNSISSIERFKKLLKVSDSLKKLCVFGNALSVNKSYVTTIEYDELSKTLTSFKHGKCILFFDQGEATKYLEKENPLVKPDGTMFVGLDKTGENVYIDINTQKTRDGKSIIDIILDAAGDDIKATFEKIKAPKKLMLASVTVMQKPITVGLLLGFWEGLSSILKKAKVNYRLENSYPSNLKANESFLKFKNCYFVYEDTVPVSLLLNGFNAIDLSKYDIEDMDMKETYMEYLIKVYGQAQIANALQNEYEFMIDNITKEILMTLSLPTDIVNVVIYAVSLLADSQFVPEINAGLSRIRSNEVIPAILYDRIAKNYIKFRNSSGRKKFSIPRDCVIKEVLAQKTIEDYSTLNPILEFETTYGLSTKGFRGANLDESHTIAKRTYDPTMTGIVAPSTSPDGNVGVSKTLSMEPTIKSLRGFTDINVDSLKKMKDVNLFSIGELSIPLGATIDDPTRLGHAIKQSRHVIPVKDSSPVLISNGVEEVCRFRLSSDFVVNAEESGEIVAYDKETDIMIAKYKSGKCRAINLGNNIVKNGGGGFFLNNKLVTPLQVGSKFKKDDVLAYHKDFFTNDNFNNCRMNMGTLTKVAIMSTYNTYQDATMITEQLADKASTEMVFCKSVSIGKNANVDYIVKKGDHISVGDSLIQFDTSFEDNSLNELLSKLSDNAKEDILQDSRNNIHSKYSGVIEEIKIYSTVDLDELSPTLRKIVRGYYNKIKKKKEFLDSYDPDSKNSIVKCGLLMNETNHKIEPNKFGVIKGEKVEDAVLIEFYIKHSEPLEIGSKIANFTALKNTIGEIIPAGYEPWSETRPDEEISTIIASNSILKRMTPSILLTALGNKNIIELKRKIKSMFDEYMGSSVNGDLRNDVENLIYRFFTAFDKSGTNTTKYKELFQQMTNSQFDNYFKMLFSNDKAYLTLDIVDYEHTMTLDDIERAAKVIGIELFEYVYMPHLTMDKTHVICTKEKVPVGYINIKRTQQTVSKKNGISTNIDQRSAITGQVTGADKNGRESDLENTMLASLGMEYTLQELNGARADDITMKNQMLRDISLNGYTTLASMESDLNNKTTLNTVDVFLMGMSIKSDLVTSGLMTKKSIKNEL